MLDNFKIKAIMLMMAILIGIAFTAYSIASSGVTTMLMIVIPVLAILIWQLFRLVDKTNMEVAAFLDNIRYNDYAVSFTEKKTLGESFQNLHGAFNLVNQKFRDIRSEKEAQFQ